MLISFLGTLPLGTLNIAAMQISVQECVNNALYFSFGALTVEMIYVRISLVAIDWVRKQERLMKIMEWATFFIILALAAGSFISALKSGSHPKNVFLQNHIHRFFLGMMMGGINPVQIPFWFGWSSILFTKKILQPVKSQYNFYIIGIGLGTFMGNCIFIFGGKWVVQKIANSQEYFNWIIGSVFTLTAILQLIKMLRHKDAIYTFTHSKDKGEM